VGAQRKARDERQDIYVELTAKIVASLEQGKIPWQKPWDPEKCAGPQAPFNAVTGRHYHRINVLSLALSPVAFFSGDPRWCTYRQAKEEGWQVRAGEKATTIFFAKPLEVENKIRDRGDQDSPATRLIHMLRAYAVFHVSQMDGPLTYKPPTVEEAPWTRPDAAQTILANSGAIVRTGGDKAFYSPSTDHIQLPPDRAFIGPSQFSATLLHEVAHWTGAEKRLNRDLSGGFGSKKYAEEELIAEFSSFFVCNTLNLPTDCTQNGAYIGHWAERLKTDSKAVFKAAAIAQKVSDYVLAFHPDYQPDAAYEEAPKPLDHVLPATSLPQSPALLQPT
jgi:antirestriction protein ArdC